MNIASKLNQTAVYWAPGAVDNYGNRNYSAGVEVSVRWQQRREEFTNVNGKKEVSQAIVYYEGQAVTLKLGGKLFQGVLADLTAGEIADPNIVTEAYRIKQNGDSPSVAAGQFLGKVWL